MQKNEILYQTNKANSNIPATVWGLELDKQVEDILQALGVGTLRLTSDSRVPVHGAVEVTEKLSDAH